MSLCVGIDAWIIIGFACRNCCSFHYNRGLDNADQLRTKPLCSTKIEQHYELFGQVQLVLVSKIHACKHEAENRRHHVLALICSQVSALSLACSRRQGLFVERRSSSCLGINERAKADSIAIEKRVLVVQTSMRVWVQQATAKKQARGNKSKAPRVPLGLCLGIGVWLGRRDCIQQMAFKAIEV